MVAFLRADTDASVAALAMGGCLGPIDATECGLGGKDVSTIACARAALEGGRLDSPELDVGSL